MKSFEEVRKELEEEGKANIILTRSTSRIHYAGQTCHVWFFDRYSPKTQYVCLRLSIRGSYDERWFVVPKSSVKRWKDITSYPPFDHIIEMDLNPSFEDIYTVNSIIQRLGWPFVFVFKGKELVFKQGFNLKVEDEIIDRLSRVIA